ncbi:hypothetical protein ABVK25_010047 [Lepraria finkii]|uniref:Aminoglycoside phosphotransferase domain-containing protein n=1 Tax=Lepraria finkii TaxID=1340010 RepID=A0ABR4AVU0_9LECA
MEITNTDQLAAYLKKEQIRFGSLEQLSGGNANFVWRMIDGSEPGKSVIIKHAEAYVAASKSRMPLPVERMDFEHLILSRLAKILDRRAPIVTPECYQHDPANHVLMLQDGGPRTLKEAYTDPNLDIQRIGRELGQWVATLHRETTALNIGDNQTANFGFRYSYSNLATTLQKYGLNPSVGERVDKEYGNLLDTDDECVCHGDFWPGNVLVDGRRLMVVDWEMVRRGCGAKDVGQFAAEAWLLDRFRGGRGLLPAFLSGYCEDVRQEKDSDLRGAVKPGKESLLRVATQMGSHLAFWPARVSWGTEEETKEIIEQGFELLVRALDYDMDWFEGSILKQMFGGTGELSA